MRSSAALLVTAVLLPGALSPLLYQTLMGRSQPPMEIVVKAEPVEVRVTEVLPTPLSWEDRACQAQASHEQRLSATAGDRLELQVGTGSLVVRGIEEGEEVRLQALLCASDVERLASMDVELRRVMGPDLRLETLQPDPDGALGWSDDEYARIDIVLEVPAGMAMKVEDSSGPVVVSGVGDLELTDGAGEIDVQDVRGRLRIDDGSGSLMVRSVVGDVEILGGSGSVLVDGVEGSLRVAGSSGGVLVSGVTGEVDVPEGATVVTPR